MRKSGWLLMVGMLVFAAANTHVFAANCGGATAAPTEIKVTSGGTTRTVAAHFGKGYDGRKMRPLVLDLHASGSNAAAQARISGMGAAADRHGFVVAWPEGAVRLPASPDGHYWNIPGVALANGAATPAGAMDDTKFIDDLITHLTAEACIDARAVFVTGLSGGARMSSHLACRLSGRIAGIAPVGGVRAGRARANDVAAVESDSCKPQQPVAVIAFHGTDDAVNSYQGSTAPHWGYAVPVALDRWAAANGCEAQPDNTSFAETVGRRSYRGCRANTVVELYSLETSRENGGGHTWPGSTAPVPESLRATLGLPSRTLDATEIMSRFFVQYRPGAERGQAEGINDPYLAPDLKVAEWVERFEGESREVFAHRHRIAASLDLKPGQSVADVGAGTGLYVPFLAQRVGRSGKVYAVDISRPFVEHIARKAKATGLTQVTAVLGTERSIELPANSVDMIFTSDAYHHFVHYQDMLASMRQALRPGGQLIVIDYDIEAKGLAASVIEHVGKKKAEFRRQIEAGGFEFAQDMTLKEMNANFIYRFVKPANGGDQ